MAVQTSNRLPQMSEDLDRYYLILGLEPDASVDEVRLAYRDCVDAWHPDRFSHAPERQQRAQARLRQINDAYRKLRRQARTASHKCEPDRTSSRPPSDSNGAETGRSRATEDAERRAGAGRRSSPESPRASRADAQAAAPPAAPPHAWLELTKENPLMLSALYFSGLGVIAAIGCGITLGAIHGGPIGAMGGLLVSPLAGVSVGGVCGAASSLVAGKMGGRRGHIIGGALAALAPGTAIGALIVGSGVQAVAAASAPALHVAFGGACGGALGATLGGWAGKAVAEMLELPY